MNVTELNRDQIIELKQSYYCHVLHADEGVSYGELAEINRLVTDEEVKEYYAGTDFVPEDFVST